MKKKKNRRELNFKKGDIIQIQKYFKKNRAKGKILYHADGTKSNDLPNEIGFFPRDKVTKLEVCQATSNSNGMLDELPANYQGATMLDFNKGNTIIVISKGEDWSRGFLESKGPLKEAYFKNSFTNLSKGTNNSKKTKKKKTQNLINTNFLLRIPEIMLMLNGLNLQGKKFDDLYFPGSVNSHQSNWAGMTRLQYLRVIVAESIEGVDADLKAQQWFASTGNEYNDNWPTNTKINNAKSLIMNNKQWGSQYEIIAIQQHFDIGIFIIKDIKNVGPVLSYCPKKQNNRFRYYIMVRHVNNNHYQVAGLCSDVQGQKRIKMAFRFADLPDELKQACTNGIGLETI